MYFVTKGGSVYHILSDARTGEAPCGVRLSRLELLPLKDGRQTRHLLREKPSDIPPCKHCDKSKHW
jgi:hypothetical protein